MTVQVSDGSLSAREAMAVRVVSVDDNTPAITSGSAFSVAENATAVTTVMVSDADLPAQALTFSIAGGADAARFTIDAATGALRFLLAPDHEAPGDADADNVYNVTVQVSDGTLSARQALAVTVIGVNDNAPTFQSDWSPATVSVVTSEGARWSAAVPVADADLPAQALRLVIAGGADAELFALDPVSGLLTFLPVADHELPQDTDGDNVYEVAIAVGDGELSAQRTLYLRIANVNEAPVLLTSSLAVSQGGQVTLDTHMLLASDPDSDASALVYTVGGVQSGAFVRLAAPDQAIERFTQAEVLAGEVVFVQAGLSGVQTAFDLSVSDGDQTVGPLRVVVQVQAAEPEPAVNVSLLSVPESVLFPSAPPTIDIDSVLPTPVGSRMLLDQIMADLANLGLPPASEADTDSQSAGNVAATASASMARAGSAGATVGGPYRGFGPMPSLLPGARATPYVDATSTPVVPDLSRLPASDLLVMLDVPIDLSGFLQERMALLQWTSLEDRSRAAAELAEQQQGQRDQGPALRWDSGDTVQAGGMALSVGLVFWATRAGGLIASLAAVAPPWRQFDPLPVLSVHAPRQPEGTEVEWLDTDIPGSLGDLAEDILDHKT